MISISKQAWIWMGAAVAALCAVPWVITENEYLLRVITVIIFWIGMSGCWNLMSGYTGYVDFGPVAYFGIGSYVTAIGMTKLGGSFFLCAPLGGVIAGLIALPIGAVALRLRGAYFAIATFAFAESMKQICLEFDRAFGVSFFEGSHGITLPISSFANIFFFYCILAVTMAVMLIHLWVERSKYGMGLKAIHESEDSAEIAGVNTMNIKLRAYIMSAVFVGILGGIESYWITYITPSDVFNVHKTVQMVIMTLLGGMGTILGPVVGASFLTILSEVLGTEFVENYLIMVGVIIIIIILIMPKGIIGTIKEAKGIRLI